MLWAGAIVTAPVVGFTRSTSALVPNVPNMFQLTGSLAVRVPMLVDPGATVKELLLVKDGASLSAKIVMLLALNGTAPGIGLPVLLVTSDNANI